MSNIINKIVGPIGEEYCLYFYILSAASLFVFITIILLGFISLFQRNKMDIRSYIYVVLSSIQIFLSYISNRLLYNMCISSI